MAIGIPFQAQASGFRIPEISTVGTATANALVANTDELGALAYNPAGMAFHKENGFVAGLTYLTYDLSVDPEGGTKTDSDGKNSFVIPNLYFMATGSGNLSYGLAINSPFGLETKWASGTFPNFGSLEPLAPEQSTIEMLKINPNMAFRIDDHSGFSIGFSVYDLKKLVFNAQEIKINGRGNGLGWNVGYQMKVDKLSFGIAYQSRVKVPLSGTFDSTELTLPLAKAILSAQSSLVFPDILQFGVAYQFTDKLQLEFDIDQTGWSSFDQINVKSEDGSTLTSSTNNWDDALAYRLGAIYRLTPQTQLMFGYSIDQKAQPDEYFSARVPDADRQLFSLGMTHDFDGWTLEAAYMHVSTDSRTINSSVTYPKAPGDYDPNGTDAYNGTYESSVNLFSIGLSMKF